ncbi:MAG: hypothetical protein LC721_02850, partial [Actinobacteria bacterium]|nr:hypothetical protein [Actinomycetota bacterium]
MRSATAELERVERIIDAAAITKRIELLLPIGVRPRQLTVRALLVGMTLTMLSGRDALLVEAHRALTGLPEPDQRRLGVIADWKHGPHTLTYRQLEYTHRLIVGKLSKPEPDGTPSEILSEVLDRLLEASVQVLGEPATSSYAVDWTGHETWSRPPPKPAATGEPQTASAADHGQSANTDSDPQPADTQPATTPDAHPPDERERRHDREAVWGHRNTNHPSKSEMFFGYHLQALTAVRDEHGPHVPELARRMQLTSCAHDPPA